MHMRKKFYTALSFYHTEIGMAAVEKFYDSDLNSARFYELFTPFDESFISFEECFDIFNLTFYIFFPKF